MKRFVLIFISLLACCYGAGQSVLQGDKWVEYLEDLAENTENEEQIETLYTDLSYLAEHPLDLNTATAEAFRRLPFLSDGQIDSILAYRKRYGIMASVYELKNVEELDRSTLELLSAFVYAGETDTRLPLTFRNLRKYGVNELVVRFDPALQRKQGYEPQPDSILQQYPNRKYTGESFYHSFRYSRTFDDRMQAGFVAEKDAGEPFANRIGKGYDYYSAHLLLRDIGRLKTLVVGDYKVSFGQGLVISHDFTPGRNAFLAQAERRTNGFRRHYSTNELNFFRGAAATLRWKDMEASFFYSYRHLDATIHDEYITSFKTDGLHRTEGDREKMHTAKTQTYGGNIRYSTPHLVVGATAVSYHFGNLSVEPEPAPYNRFYFRGRQNVNFSADYLWTNNRLKLFGETAVSGNGGLATLNALQWTPASYASGLILYRSYARNYQAFYGNAFAQSSQVQNEQGIYMGMQIDPAAHWKVSGYADFFRFPWLKYGVDAPSSGVEYMVQVDYAAQGALSSYLRYRYRQKESGRISADESESLILPDVQHRIRWQAAYDPTTEWLLRTAADVALYFEQAGRTSRGWLVSQNVAWKPAHIPLQADLYVACFHTDDYFSRIISYEKKLTYVYNTQFLYGKGMRLSGIVRYFLRKRLSFSVKTAWTHYLDGDTIGSGLESIKGRNRIELNLMMQWKI